MTGIKFQFKNCKGQIVNLKVLKATLGAPPVDSGWVFEDITRTLPASGDVTLLFDGFKIAYGHENKPYWFVLTSMDAKPIEMALSSIYSYEFGELYRYENNMWNIQSKDLAFDVIYKYEAPPEEPEGEIIEMTFSSNPEIVADINLDVSTVTAGIMYWYQMQFGGYYRIVRIEGIVKLTTDFAGDMRIRLCCQREGQFSGNFFAEVQVGRGWKEVPFDYWIKPDAYRYEFYYQGEALGTYGVKPHQIWGTLYMVKLGN